MNRNLNRAVGLSAWAIGLAIVGFLIIWSKENSVSGIAQTVSTAILNRSSSFTMTDPAGRLRTGDPVFLQTPDESWKQVGSVGVVNKKERAISIAWFENRSPDEFQFVGHSQTGRLDEVIATMLPLEQQRRIRNRISELMNQHGEEITRSMTPIVQDSLRQSMPIIQTALEDSVARHRDELDRLAERWNDEIVQDRLVPLAREELLPIVRQHAQPQAEEIGRELWERASLWRFGWRAVYDRSPLPDKDLLQEEWDRFVEEEAVPVFESHTEELVVTVQKTVQQIAANEKVRSELGQVATKLSGDPEAKRLVGTILKEALIDNNELRFVLRDVWSSPAAKRVLDQAADNIEPVVRQIGDDLFGTPETGIDPNFARVLRSQILGKDRRFIIVRKRLANQRDGSSLAPAIEWSSKPVPFPMVYLANPALESGLSAKSPKGRSL